MPFRPRDQQVHVVAGLFKTRLERHVRHLRTAVPDVKTETERGQQNRDEAGGEIVPARPGFFAGLLFRFGGGEKPAADFGAGIIRLGVADEASGAFAVQFGQLIAINGDLTVAARLRRLGLPHQRVHQDDGDSRRQYRNDNPEHKAQLLECAAHGNMKRGDDVNLRHHAAPQAISRLHRHASSCHRKRPVTLIYVKLF